MTMDVQNTSNIIKAIIEQAKQTTISVGSHKGYFISEKQVQAVLAALEDESPYNSDTPTESVVAFEGNSSIIDEQIADLNSQISFLRVTLAAAPSASRSSINIQINQLISRKARLTRVR